MSELKFREQAAIAMFAVDAAVTPEGAAVDAQRLADACCRAFGHDTVVPDAPTIQFCKRCEKLESLDESRMRSDRFHKMTKILKDQEGK